MVIRLFLLFAHPGKLMDVLLLDYGQDSSLDGSLNSTLATNTAQFKNWLKLAEWDQHLTLSSDLL